MDKRQNRRAIARGDRRTQAQAARAASRRERHEADKRTPFRGHAVDPCGRRRAYSRRSVFRRIPASGQPSDRAGEGSEGRYRRAASGECCRGRTGVREEPAGAAWEYSGRDGSARSGARQRLYQDAIWRTSATASKKASFWPRSKRRNWTSRCGRPRRAWIRRGPSLEQATANLQQGKTNAEMARLTWERWNALVQKGAVARQDVDTYKAQYDALGENVQSLEKAVNVAKSNIAVAEANLGRLTRDAGLSEGPCAVRRRDHAAQCGYRRAGG